MAMHKEDAARAGLATEQRNEMSIWACHVVWGPDCKVQRPYVHNRVRAMDTSCSELQTLLGQGGKNSRPAISRLAGFSWGQQHLPVWGFRPHLFLSSRCLVTPLITRTLLSSSLLTPHPTLIRSRSSPLHSALAVADSPLLLPLSFPPARQRTTDPYHSRLPAPTLLMLDCDESVALVHAQDERKDPLHCCSCRN